MTLPLEACFAKSQKIKVNWKVQDTAICNSKKIIDFFKAL